MTDYPFGEPQSVAPCEADTGATARTDSAVPPVPSRRLIFAMVAMALFMGSVDFAIVATALPAIHDSLHARLNWVGWTITIYGLGMAISLPVAGKLSDQFGRRRVFLCGIALFTGASLLCGFAPNIYLLIAFRAFQSVGGGALTPSAAGLVAEHFGSSRDRAIGLFGTVNTTGQVTGPVLGGLLVAYFSWRWIFFVNVPIGLVLLWLILKFVPKSHHGASAKTDVGGVALLSFLVLAAMLGITNLGNGGTALYGPTIVVPGVCALAMLYWFGRHTRRVADPFIPQRLLTGHGFRVLNCVSLLLGVVTSGSAALVPFYAEERYHLSAFSAGTLLTASALGALATGVVAALTGRRTGYRLPLIIGFVVLATGWLLMSSAPRFGVSPYVWISVCAGVTGMGIGIVSPASRNAGLHLAPDDVAAISGLRQMFINFGVIISVSATTAIINRSATPGLTQAHVFWVIAAILLAAMVPLACRIPEHRGTW